MLYWVRRTSVEGFADYRGRLEVAVPMSLRYAGNKPVPRGAQSVLYGCILFPRETQPGSPRRPKHLAAMGCCCRNVPHVLDRPQQSLRILSVYRHQC